MIIETRVVRAMRSHRVPLLLVERQVRDVHLLATSCGKRLNSIEVAIEKGTVAVCGYSAVKADFQVATRVR